jgi:uncharacterized membrane protein
VTGYAENPGLLPFLNSSQYSYEKETAQLYALTNALTRKEGDTWTMTFVSPGYYEDYRATFYLPDDFKIKNVSSSQGLEYLVSASNDSLALDFQGYDVSDPVADIEYQQPLEASGPPALRPPDLNLLLLMLAVGAAAAIGWRYKPRGPHSPSAANVETPAAVQNGVKPSEETISTISSEPEKPSGVIDVMAGEETQPSNPSAEGIENPSKIATGTSTFAETPPPSEQPAEQTSLYEGRLSSEPEETEEGDEEDEARTDAEAEIQLSSARAEKIEISSEMAAVMETLTQRERAILQALIDRGGRSTQASLRYETRTPKSSLTTIIYSLERRKLIIKKEWGRTNVIELSDWFLSKKERS